MTEKPRFKVNDVGRCESLLLETDAVRVHLVLNWEQCDWSSGDYLKGDKEAETHVEETGHTVTGEYGLSVRFEGIPA